MAVLPASPELLARPNTAGLTLLSVVIPAHNEEGCIGSTVAHLHLELRLRGVPHEIVVVDDGSTDSTWQKLLDLCNHIPELKPVQNYGQHGFGRAIARGFACMTGDAAVVMMADESDDCRDVVARYRAFTALRQGNPRIRRFIAELGEASPHFARWWVEHEVHGQAQRPRSFRHPRHGVRTMQVQVLVPTESDDVRLVLHLPSDDSPEA